MKIEFVVEKRTELVPILLILISVSDALHSSVQKYWFTLDDCGIGRESQLMDNTCFDYHKTSEQMDAIRFGRPKRVGEFPYVVHLNMGGGCTGSIVNQNWIISAAHCVVRGFNDSSEVPNWPILTPNWPKTSFIIEIDYKKHIGVNRFRQRFPVKYSFVYPLYNSMYFDIALLRLWRPMNLSAVIPHGFKDLNGICFPPKWAFNNRYEHALMVGFGSIGDTVYNSSETSAMETGWGRIYPLGRGGMFWEDKSGNFIRLRQLITEGSSAACSGDSGGPLVQYVNGRAVLIGVFFGMYGPNSSYKGCPHETSENGYARVSYFIDWINETITLGDQMQARDEGMD